MKRLVLAFGLTRVMAGLCWSGLLLALVAAPVSALITGGIGNAPVGDQNWPAGAVELANMTSRVGWWEGPPFGGGEYQFLYRGDTGAFQTAIDLFARIRSPELRLVVHQGPHESFWLKSEKDPKANAQVDWTFTVWNPQCWNNLYNNPKSVTFCDETTGHFRRPVDPPQIDVYVAAPDGAGIDWRQVKVPANVSVSNELASAAGYAPADGSVIRGDVYDMATSKPVAGAKIAIQKWKVPPPGSRGSRQEWEEVLAGKGDDRGHFELKNVPADSYRFIVTAEGYVPRAVAYTRYGTNSLKEYVVYLARPAIVKGTVTDTDSQPIAGVTVRADNVMAADGRGYGLADHLTATSDAQGRFELSGLPTGFLRLYTSHASHQMLDVFTIHSAPADHLTVRMTATGTIKGKVTRPDGTGVTSGQVSVDPDGDPLGKWGGGRNLSPDGSFVFENVPPGKYTLSTDPGAMRPGLEPIAKALEMKIAKVIEVKAGQTTEVELKAKE